MSDYRLVAKIQNNRIMSLIELYKYKNVSEFCVDNNLSRCPVGDVINMKVRPLTKDGKYRKIVEDIATALRVHPDALFTESQRVLKLERNVAETTFGEVRFLELSGGDNPETLLLESEGYYELIDGVRDTLTKLTPREQRVIGSLYGMDGGQRKNLRGMGEELGVSPERIRQVEAKAFRKLRKRFAGNKLFDDYTGEYRYSH